jgi:hypothetical protein
VLVLGQIRVELIQRNIQAHIQYGTKAKAALFGKIDRRVLGLCGGRRLGFAFWK